MDEFLQVVVSNGVIATALAAFAAIAARCRVSPAVVHLLWLLVLAKLFTPPVLPVTVLPAGLLWPTVVSHPEPEAVPQGNLSDNLAMTEPTTPSGAADLLSFLRQLGGLVPDTLSWQQALLAVWVIGCAFMAVRYAWKVLRVRRLLQHAGPAPEFLLDIARCCCNRLGIRRCPEIVTLPVRLTPAVWSLGGGPRILFPIELVRTMPHEQLETLLAHELAHVRRRDHLVRLAELAATTIFWWHPVVWWVRTELREMEEQACDALVLRSVPHGARTYAIALVETLEFLSLQSRPLPIGATAASPTVSLQRRIEMLKQGSSRRLTVAAALVGGAVFLPALTLALAAEPRPTIAFSTETDEEGKPSVKVVISGIPPEGLSPERVRTLVDFLDQKPHEDWSPRKTRTAEGIPPERVRVLIDEFRKDHDQKDSAEGDARLMLRILQLNKSGTEIVAETEVERARAAQKAAEQRIAEIHRAAARQSEAQRLAALEMEEKLDVAKRGKIETARNELEKMTQRLAEQAQALERAERDKEIEAVVRDLEEQTRRLIENTRGAKPEPGRGKSVDARPPGRESDSSLPSREREPGVRVWEVVPGQPKKPASPALPAKKKESSEPESRDPQPRAEIRDIDEVVRDLDALLRRRAAEAARTAELERKEIDKAVKERWEEADRKAKELEETYDALRKEALQQGSAAQQSAPAERAKAAESTRREAEEAERAAKARSLQGAEEAERWRRAVELLKKAEQARPSGAPQEGEEIEKSERTKEAEIRERTK